MAHEVVDRVERLVERQGERLRRANADHKRAAEAGAARHGYCVEIFERDIRLCECLFESRNERLEVGSRRDLWHNPAVASVLVH